MADPQLESTFGPNAWLVEDMRRRFEEDPESVSHEWRDYFGSNGERGSPVQPTQPAPSATPRVSTGQGDVEPPSGSERLKGVSARIAERMDASLRVPTATSFRSVPAKLLEVNRKIVNNQLHRLTHAGKVSFTHLIGWAVVEAMAAMPDINVAYQEIDGAPHVIKHGQVNLGIAIDVPRKDGTRSLLVPNIKAADGMTFRHYWETYEDVVRRVRENAITPEDFFGTTVSLTNPGTLGTMQSVPRLMPDHGLIVGVGAIAYPPEYHASDSAYLARQGIGRVVTLSSTYDHRVIQGAQSGLFLGRIHELLLGQHGFYDRVFQSMDIPYTPASWARDDNPTAGSEAGTEKRARVLQLINMYRVRGHLIADLDPLRQAKPALHPELDPLTYGLSIWDLERPFATGGLLNRPTMKLGDILGVLRNAYCRTIGLEYMHIQDPAQKEWIQSRVEKSPRGISRDQRLRILHKLNHAEAFEHFLHRKYTGQKRFGLEGSESLIPLLDAVLESAADDAMQEVVIGMAHRGRLNVLANVVGKSYTAIFQEFEGDLDPETVQGSGDVKYHVGASGRHRSASGTEVAVSVVANPSHLEAVDPVLEGVVRARQESRGNLGHQAVLPVLVHGDAAFAGQGVVVETFHLSQLKGYRTGGTVHVVVNNQVGFTTSALEARSSHYATDVAKTVQAPIIHVNGDDPEAVVRAAEFAFAYRQAFNRDVVIDLICYRRRGHNEGDEPSFTQPLMYRIIDAHPSVRSLYLDRLVNTEELTVTEGTEMLHEFETLLSEAFEETKRAAPLPGVPRFEPEPDNDPETGVALDVLAAITAAISSPPAGFTLHPKLVKAVTGRQESFNAGTADWALAEALAIGSLAEEGVPVRFAGEDTRRGTFSHRHASLVDNVTGAQWTPLEERTEGVTRVRFVDSLLSEFAAVGFEYGYSVDWTDALVMWEAQFGDFVNGAQVIIDQFIAAGEDKWNQPSGLVMLLPHGFEGQGPEHSSARIERFLQLCAEDNIRVVVPSTTDNYFHLLRRQAHKRPRKPMVLFSPKSLLRHRPSFGTIASLTSGSFKKVIDDPSPPAKAQRLVLCTGKIFYDLQRERDARDDSPVALVRLEQLYPYPESSIRRLVERYPGAEVTWAQEEPANMGAWPFLRARLANTVDQSIPVFARPESASPATGSHKHHVVEQEALVGAALAV